ncbi:hypothetical protein C343_03143 [Cryptococcus neoformans C23]|uniref:Uncharacterized protein n=2 Tax=Cryptococcus neoformans TaxID=5207 RepID=A0A854QE45_CRYNE|nr:hypothetical protein CNAG_01093 [Cryptococcus neoformans var. grubii H99]AUB24795.1 hypothetical protein CKF44_01093 [Cryptococcus neoformans var. grubii]OWZ32507.1 hypothetical protein C347_03206 [Cryptococcus neoformans var. grubii AD2-60a]OWZ44029.1 hypothetical protein C353_03046 [Cryptococcus neoformans var. grubii AD1-83a]OWZ44354.1 hypothetical protein C343_03143 [Cryptococcus neoformans var. grubii C23]OWZ57629.1 hypothetical protein C368_00795 [Cryptococcus neoformans var. grubii 1|eukprot:XP_012049062.1 hypothetical protein CNAG_01093 [Cryptococcus neoformans var. grubii H99]
MTTSITDARHSILHLTPASTLALSFDDPPETGWSVMPGFDESIPVPLHLEPPRGDGDEILPSQLHPSYPLGRPTYGKGKGISGKAGRKVGNLLGTVDAWGKGSRTEAGAAGEPWCGGRGEVWGETGLGVVVEEEKRREVPPGMAGAKRPPTPPPPSLRPNQLPLPRSIHLRHMLERQQVQEEMQRPQEGFDGPVPNETYDDSHQQGGDAAAEEQSHGGDMSRSQEWEGESGEGSYQS